MTKRTLWTSGTSDVDAMNKVGRERPWCGTAATAQQYAGYGEALYRITVEAFSLDRATLVDAYVAMIDPDGGDPAKGP